MLPLIQRAASATNSAKNIYFSLPVYRTACFGFCVYSKHNITSLRYNSWFLKGQLVTAEAVYAVW